MRSVFAGGVGFFCVLLAGCGGGEEEPQEGFVDAAILADAPEHTADAGSLDANEASEGGVIPYDGGDPDDGGTLTKVTVAGIFNVLDQGAKGDGTDATAAIRAAVKAASAAGGGIVYFPAGRYLISSTITVPAGITLAGQGFNTPGAGAPQTLSGSWLIVSSKLLNDDAVALLGMMRDLGMWHEQPTPGATFTPRAFGWAINMARPDSMVRHLWLANPTLGIKGTGRVTIEDVSGQPLVYGISIDGAYDVVRIRKIRFNWTADGGAVWSTAASVKGAMGIGLQSLRNDNPQMNDIKIAGYSTGIRFGGSSAGATSKFAMMDTYVNDSPRCITVDGDNTTGKFTRLWAKNCGSTGLWITGQNAVISGADVDIREVGGNAARVDGANAFLLLNQLNVVNWDKAGKGFPGVEVSLASARAKVGLFHNLTGGAVQFGGVGPVTVDTNAANAAFDLRVPTPTAIVEDTGAPVNAKIDVRMHGAKGDGVTDDAAAIQAALDAASKAGGGSVVVPAGQYLLKSGITVPSGVSLVGVGWQGQGGAIDSADGSIGTTKPFVGSYFSVPATSTADVVKLSDNTAIRMLGFYWDQGAVTAGWSARSYGWAVRVTGTKVQVRDLFLLNPTKGIAVTSSGAGAVLIDHVFGSPQKVGLYLDTNATVRVNDVHYWPFWGISNTTFGKIVGPETESVATAFQSDHTSKAEFSNIFSIFYLYGLELGQSASGVSTDFRLWNADMDVGVRGYVVSGPGTQATFANWSVQGDTGAITGVTGVWAQAAATNAKLFLYNGDARFFAGNAIRSDAPASDIRVNLSRLEGWGSAGGFPSVESAATGPQMWLNGN